MKLMELPKHSELPFTIIGKQGTAIWSENDMIAHMSEPRENIKLARSNAEFITIACNSFYEMVSALEKIIAMNKQYAKDKYGSESKAYDMACVKEARSALGFVRFYQDECTRGFPRPPMDETNYG